MKSKMPHAVNMSKSRAAGMAAATRGRARVYAGKGEVDDSAEQIDEALEARKASQKVSVEELAADYSGLS